VTHPEQVLRELIELARELGREDRHLAILGEGNVSAACGDGTFWVKASGSRLADIDAAGFCRVRLDAALALIDGARGDEEIMDALRRAEVGGSAALPSIETFLHAVCLADGATWVAHTHPVAVNGILCSRAGAEPFLQHVFPDAVVVCGRRPVVVPYADPGVPLARAVRDELRGYRQNHEERPRTVLLANHGLVALGRSRREALGITLMADKWARILAQTYAFGGPQPLPDLDVDRIDRRPDEQVRRHRLVEP